MASFRELLLWSAVVGTAATIAASVQAQPYRCGGRVPFAARGGCQWECVQEAFGGNKMRPPQMRYVWKQVCRPGSLGPPAGGPAEIHKKNVPAVRKNHGPGPYD
jgi:hypothetical protein